MVIPPKLRKGDEVRIIAPSRSMKIISDNVAKEATRKLEELGLKVTFGKHIHEADMFLSATKKGKLKDLQEAFNDKNVKAILTGIGGWNSNSILTSIDYELIKNNPKIYCGYSDTSLLQNAFLTQSNLVTYSGPHYSHFGMKKHFEYNLEYFKKCLFEEKPFKVKPSKIWTDDTWYISEEERDVNKNEGYWLIQPGKAKGTIIGGNLGTINLLWGTKYMPNLTDKIVFLEDCDPITPVEFDRLLQSLLYQNGGKDIQAIVIGRFQKSSNMTREKLEYIIKTKDELKNVPVLANVDFGHTNPMITFPIGGTCAVEDKKIRVVDH